MLWLTVGIWHRILSLEGTGGIWYRVLSLEGTGGAGARQMRRVGLVKRVDHQARTAVVTWLSDPAGGSLHLRAGAPMTGHASAHLDSAPEESVSVYSVMVLPLSFRTSSVHLTYILECTDLPYV